MMQRRLYLDCDGVLANFDRGFEDLFGRKPNREDPKMPPQEMWDALRDHPDFYGSLPLMNDALYLVDNVKHLRPIILTGMPRGDWALPQKMRWRSKHFPNLVMQTCSSKDKYLFCQPGDILVDDWPKHMGKWKAAGGAFIHHKNAVDTIAELIAWGVL